jgi:hypothetical protein
MHNEISLSRNLVQAALTYLDTKPHNEVAGLIQRIMQEAQQSDMKKEREAEMKAEQAEAKLEVVEEN